MSLALVVLLADLGPPKEKKIHDSRQTIHSIYSNESWVLETLHFQRQKKYCFHNIGNLLFMERQYYKKYIRTMYHRTAN